jgi:acyl dehydratase
MTAWLLRLKLETRQPRHAARTRAGLTGAAISNKTLPGSGPPPIGAAASRQKGDKPVGAAMDREDLIKLVGQEIGVSGWRTVDQARIDAFAQATDDHQFIHVDPERAKRETPFGGTIAHGFLSLSILSGMAYEVMPTLNGAAMSINYGFDKIRFLAPVRAGKRVRARFTLSEATMRAPKELLIRNATTLEIEDEPKPALIADWLGLHFFN